ncbi:MAG: hypothetical protein ACREAF_03235 [Nitrosopumilaceae archaeon]
MEFVDVCYYLVPASLGVFGLGMTVFLRRSMKDEPSKIERELQRLAINAKSRAKRSRDKINDF